MKHYAQFYQWSTGYIEGSSPPKFDPANKTLIEACGDRAVICIDGRLSEWKRGFIAHAECKKRGFIAYRLMCGETLTRAMNNGPVVKVQP